MAEHVLLFQHLLSAWAKAIDTFHTSRRTIHKNKHPNCSIPLLSSPTTTCMIDLPLSALFVCPQAFTWILAQSVSIHLFPLGPNFTNQPATNTVPPSSPILPYTTPPLPTNQPILPYDLPSLRNYRVSPSLFSLCVHPPLSPKTVPFRSLQEDTDDSSVLATVDERSMNGR